MITERPDREQDSLKMARKAAMLTISSAVDQVKGHNIKGFRESVIIPAKTASKLKLCSMRLS